MKYYKLIIEIDEIDIAGEPDIELYVQHEANWMIDSGIYTVSITEISKQEAEV